MCGKRASKKRKRVTQLMEKEISLNFKAETRINQKNVKDKGEVGKKEMEKRRKRKMCKDKRKM